MTVLWPLSGAEAVLGFRDWCAGTSWILSLITFQPESAMLRAMPPSSEKKQPQQASTVAALELHSANISLLS
eukprot:s779_g3.t1